MPMYDLECIPCDYEIEEIVRSSDPESFPLCEDCGERLQRTPDVPIPSSYIGFSAEGNNYGIQGGTVFHSAKERKEYEEKFKRLVDEHERLEDETKNLLRKMKTVPKKTAQMAHENTELIEDTASMHYNLGVFYAENKRFDRAISEFKRALDLNPHDSRAHYNLGYLYAQEYENHRLARGHFLKYLKLAPDDDGAGWVNSYLVGRSTFDGKVLKN